MTFSLIIPCYNSSKTIRPLFDSLTRQGLNKEDLQIIVVDDNSTDLSYQDIISEYKNQFNIEYHSTDVSVHCPGNTRQAGMKYVKGDWLCFIDHDDRFEDKAFKRIKEYIDNLDHKAYVLATYVSDYNLDKDEYYGYKKDYLQSLLHGKWYSMNDLIRPFNIAFKKDLVSHEDGYFNNLCLKYLIKMNTDWDYLGFPGYIWCHNKDSVSRNENNGRGYLYEHFKDYIDVTEPFYEYAKAEDSDSFWFMNQVMMTLLHAYFYYEEASFHYGANKFMDMLGYIKDLYKLMLNELHYTKDQIVDYIYSDPKKYQKIYQNSFTFNGPFVCKTSFVDFINKLDRLGIIE